MRVNNFFASEQKCPKNALNLAHEFLYDNFNKKILINLLVRNCLKKTPVLNLMHFKK